jgi:hypothetical protein
LWGILSSSSLIVGHSPISGLINELFLPSSALILGLFTPPTGLNVGFIPISGLFEGLYPDNVLIHLQ